MHIPDGFLANEVAVACAIPAVAAVGYGLRRAEVELDDRRVPLLGVTAAFVFAAQMLNFPVAGGTSGHFLGAALAAVLLGPWLAGLVLAVVLVVQAFVFADGGITAARRDELVGEVVEVLVDSPGVARSHREAPEIDGIVAVPEHLPVGSIQRVRITGAAGPDCEAEPLALVPQGAAR